MIKTSVVGASAVAIAMLLAPAAAQAAPIKAGVGVTDATWHVGASAGQYASDGATIGPEGSYNPSAESTRRSPSYGVQSRLTARAIVVEGTDGKRIAVVKNDLYLAQDLLWRRTAQLLAAKPELKIDRSNLTIAVTHNHSSPYYSSSSPGVWTFQDVIDVRFYEYYARQMAAAVEKAATSLVPVRVGASVSQFDKTHRHSFGPQIADDGTPAGYPQGDADHDLTVIRFDDISNPSSPKPLANLVNFSLHPEFLDGNDLISADYLGPLERMVDRETEAVTIWTQGAVGTAEPERSTYHSIHERLEFSHKEYAQAEYGARLMADAIVDTWKDVSASTPQDGGRFVPFASDVPVGMVDRWFPGPNSHPYPGVSSCRSDAIFSGDPRVPVVGLPDCASAGQGLATLTGIFGLPRPPALPGVNPGLSTDDIQRLGIPFPENYSAPSYGALEESVNIHLQAFRIGDILFPVCSCEQWKDQSENIETRTNRTVGDQFNGFDWSKRCTRNENGTHTCPDPRNEAKTLAPISDLKFRRLDAQVNKDAKGWNDLDYVAFAEAEPPDPKDIKGNYTHEELSPELGYRLTVPIAMANDYNGYIATYREYQRGDSYRKALTAWGPHSSDYLATRLVQMGGQLNGGPPPPAEPLDSKIPPDLALNERRAGDLGRLGATSLQAYEASLPDDGGDVAAIEEPADIERFGAAFFKWNGGSNFTDNPNVRVERRVGEEWQEFADQSGEVITTVVFPGGEDTPAYASGGQRWEWTAHFEAFVSPFDTGSRPRATPAGTFRFVVRGKRRKQRMAVDYAITSREFTVSPWSGITAEDIRRDANGAVSFRVGPRSVNEVPGKKDVTETIRAEIGPIDYPDTYKSTTRFINDKRTAYRDPDAVNDPSKLELFCFECSFRPWIDAGDAVSATVTFTRADGATERFPATERGGRWVTERTLRPGERATVASSDVRDGFDDRNGRPSGVVALGLDGTPTVTPGPDDGPPRPPVVVSDATNLASTQSSDQTGTGSGNEPGPGGPGTAPGTGPGGSGSAGSRGRCLPRRLKVSSRGIGPVRLGAGRATTERRAGRPERRTAGAFRYCVRGGGRVLVAFSKRGRVRLVVTTAPGHPVRRVRRGLPARLLRGAFPGRYRLRFNVFGTRRGSRRTIVAVRHGRVRYVGVADRSAVRSPRTLGVLLRQVRLQARR